MAFLRKEDADGRNKSGHDNATVPAFRRNPAPHCPDPKIFFTIVVDAIFTTLYERLFTNVFDVLAQSSANPWVYRACNAD
jgi:hypothetical protein